MYPYQTGFMQGEAVELHSVLVRSDELVHSTVDGEVTMMNVETGRYYGLESNVAIEIWRLLERPIRVDEICNKLQGVYRVDRARCEKEVLSFVQRLAAENVVNISTGAQ